MHGNNSSSSSNNGGTCVLPCEHATGGSVLCADGRGAGALVPITGFANGVAAPAIEFQKEGQVFGIGCKIFTIAGPVILYGIFSSWVLGLIYWVLKWWGMV